MHAHKLKTGEKAKVGTKTSTQIAYAAARYKTLLDKMIHSAKRAQYTKIIQIKLKLPLSKLRQP